MNLHFVSFFFKIRNNYTFAISFIKWTSRGLLILLNISISDVKNVIIEQGLKKTKNNSKYTLIYVYWQESTLLTRKSLNSFYCSCCRRIRTIQALLVQPTSSILLDIQPYQNYYDLWEKSCCLHLVDDIDVVWTLLSTSCVWKFLGTNCIYLLL